MMRLLADENFPLTSVRLLRSRGHDVESIMESHPGAADDVVLNLAVIEGRILVTFDLDFGKLAFLMGAACPRGVVLLRFRPTTPEESGEIMLSLIEQVGLEGKFTVVHRERVQQRSLPRPEA